MTNSNRTEVKKADIPVLEKDSSESKSKPSPVRKAIRLAAFLNGFGLLFASLMLYIVIKVRQKSYTKSKLAQFTTS